MEPSFSDCDSSSSSSLKPNHKRRRLSYDHQQQPPPPPQHHHQHQHDHDSRNQNASSQPTKRWTTDIEQQIYSSKLLRAIRHVRRSNTGRSREIRQTADRLLAVSAKGTTRWSRAILATPLSFRLKKRHVKVKTSYSHLKRKAELKKEKSMNSKLPVVEKKLRVLGGLIPGCRKISRLNLLEETIQYIAALEMQVRAMTALTEILAGAPPVENRIGSDMSS
ncbi:transcription factor bHLH149-like [Mangifera indica]|uniref:transcription factor bHLH149-like n=1 Tax=Mangifera indica TaxID=29780 RepID=UPI001CFA33BF|nr:transcription factor bHLH149-like [Mangifera indica]